MQLSTEIGEIIIATAGELTTGSSGSGPLSFGMVDYILIFIVDDCLATVECIDIFIQFFYRTKVRKITNRITIIPVQIYLNL